MVSISASPASTLATLATQPTGDSDDVPDQLKRLVRTVMRTFYTPDASLAVDLLVRKGWLADDELAALLLFEKKQMHVLLIG